ncbi:MAG TPA: signal peptidase II [Ktedonobacteraceae bacterium]
MSAKRARLYDAFALLTVFIIVLLDQWTKHLVVEKLSLEKVVPFPIFGHNLVFDYTQNSGAAFSMLKGNALLALFIIAAVGIVGYFYSRIWNTGTLSYKLVFGLIIGGALGNLLDRVIHGGYVVDFVSFRVPEVGFYFAIFNVADASISIGVFLLFVLLLFGGRGDRLHSASEEDDTTQQSTPAQEPTYTVNQKETS